MSRCSNHHENTVVESFLQLLGHTRVKRKTYPTREAARQKIFDYIKIFCNPARRNGYEGRKSPVKFAQQFFN